MKSDKKLCLIIFFIITFVSLIEASNSDSLQFELLLNRNKLIDLNINDNFIEQFDITANNLILLSSDKQLYVLGINYIKPFGKANLGIKSFALTSDSLLMIIRNKEVCTLDSVNNISLLYKIPSENMGIASGRSGMYLYDRDNRKEIKSLYFILPNGKYTKLFGVTTPINCVMENEASILFSSGKSLFAFNLKTKKIAPIATLPTNQTIKSVTSDLNNNRIYFSTDNFIFSIKDSVVNLITDKMGGILRYFNNGLIVFDPTQQLLVNIVGLEKSISSTGAINSTENKPPETNQFINNETIVKMVSIKMPDETIITTIENSNVNFNLNIDDMIQLSNQGVSSAVILAMKKVMAKKFK